MKERPNLRARRLTGSAAIAGLSALDPAEDPRGGHGGDVHCVQLMRLMSQPGPAQIPATFLDWDEMSRTAGEGCSHAARQYDVPAKLTRTGSQVDKTLALRVGRSIHPGTGAAQSRVLSKMPARLTESLD